MSTQLIRRQRRSGRSRFQSLALSAAALSVVGASTVVSAGTTDEWTNPVGGNWSNAFNWSPNRPVDGDIVNLETYTNENITFDGNFNPALGLLRLYLSNDGPGTTTFTQNAANTTMVANEEGIGISIINTPTGNVVYTQNAGSNELLSNVVDEC